MVPKVYSLPRFHAWTELTLWHSSWPLTCLVEYCLRRAPSFYHSFDAFHLCLLTPRLGVTLPNRTSSLRASVTIAITCLDIVSIHESPSFDCHPFPYSIDRSPSFISFLSTIGFDALFENLDTTSWQRHHRLDYMTPVLFNWVLEATTFA